MKQEINISQNPMFVVGCPRSGTTLLQSLIATQGGIITFPETHFFSETWQRLKVNASGFILPECLGSVLDHIYERSGITFPQTIQSTLINLCENGELTPKLLFEYLINHYLSAQVKEDTIHTARWLEKTPLHILYLDTIFDLYPNVRFVNIIRDPFAVLLSYKQSGFGAERTIQDISQKWKDSIKSYETFSAKHPDHIYSIQYEQLVTAPSETMQGICQFLGIKFDGSKLEDHATVAKGVVLPSETWKKNNLNRKIENANQKHQASFGVRLTMQHFLEDYMVKYQYPVKLSWLQPIFNVVFSVVSTARNLLRSLLYRLHLR